MSASREPPDEDCKHLVASEPTVRIIENTAARTNSDVDSRQPRGILRQESLDATRVTRGAGRERIRAQEGPIAPIVQPCSGLLPEDRYRFAAPGRGELGKGAIGQVHLVFDAVLGREVAMKVLRDEYCVTEDTLGSGQTNEATWRFLREARVTGQLEHPNIVPVHELGCRTDGSLYYTMRVVRGRTLGDALSNAKTLKERLSLLHHFTDLCHAIAYAHSRGVLHRDIKPSNVMIGEFGETFVLDWGLARVTKPVNITSAGPALSLPPNPGDLAYPSIDCDDHEHTVLGGIVGTPQYMSPEQILGDHEHLDARSDVWSLGVVLYILLTGRSPFAGDTMSEVLSRVLTKEIHPPIALEPDVPLELQAITLRALMRDRTSRYQDAGEMARDVTAFESGERVNAYEYRLLDLMRRFLGRHRAVAVVSGVALCILVFLAFLSYLRIARARDAALASEHRATAGQQLANTRYADALVERSRTAASHDDAVEAEILAAEAATIEARPDARGMIVALSGSIRLAPSSKPAPIGSCSQLVAGAGTQKLLCLSAASLTLLRGAIPQWSIQVPGALAVTPLGRNHSVVLFESRRWAMYSDMDARLQAEGPVPLSHATTILGSEHHSWLVATDGGGNLAAWDPHAAPARPVLLRSTQPVTALAFTRGRPALVLGGKFGRISSWEFSLGASTESLIGESHTTVESLVVGQRDGLVITGGSDGTVSLWDPTKAKLLGIALQRQVGISSLALSEQNRWLLAGTRNAELDLIDIQQRSRIFAVPRGAGPFRPLGFDQDGNAWVQKGSSEVVRFAVSEPSPRSRLLDRSNVLAISWLPGSDYIFSGGLRESGVCLFRVADGNCMDRIPVRMSQVRVVVVSPNGRYLLLAGTGNVLQIWDATTRLPLTVTEIPIAEIRAAVFERSQSQVYVAGVAPRVFKVELDSGRIVEHWGIDGQVQAMSMMRDSNQLLLGLRDGRLQRRDPHGTLLTETQMHQGWVSGIALGPNQDTGASIGADGKTLYWNPMSLEKLGWQQDHAGRATALAWSPDGRYLATGGEDQNLVVSEGRKPWSRVAQWQGHRGTVRSVAFDSSSRWLASGGDDAGVHLWDLQLLETDPRVVQRQSCSAWGLKLVGARVVPE